MAENQMFEIGFDNSKNAWGINEAYLKVTDPEWVRRALDNLISKLWGNEKMRIEVDTAYGKEFVWKIIGKKYSQDFVATFNSMISAFEKAKEGNVDELRKNLRFSNGTLSPVSEQRIDWITPSPATVVLNDLADAHPGRSGTKIDLSIAGALSGNPNSVIALAKKRMAAIDNAVK